MKNILLLLFLFISCSIYGQKKQWDIIELKDGKVYRGTIVEEIPGSSIRMQTESGELLFFQMSDVKKIANEKKMKEGGENGIAYFGQVEVSYLYSLLQGADVQTDSNKTLLQVSTVQGLNFNDRFNVGLGFGAAFRGEKAYFPVYVDFRTFFGDGGIQPYLHTAAGFALLFNDDNSPGNVLADISFGVRTAVSSSVSVNTSLGFNQQFYISKNATDLELNEGFLIIKIGISL